MSSVRGVDWLFSRRDIVSTPQNSEKGMIASINFLASLAHNIKNEQFATPHPQELLIEQMFAVAIVNLGASGCKGGGHKGCTSIPRGSADLVA